MVPSSNTITGWTAFSPSSGIIKSAEVMANFGIWRGHLLPFDPTATAAVDNGYDVGSSSYRFRAGYFGGTLTASEVTATTLRGKHVPNVVSTTGSMSITSSHDIILMDSSSATITGTFITAVGNTGASWVVKNIGTANTVQLDGNGTETIDGTLTVNLVPGEAVRVVAHGGNLHIL